MTDAEHAALIARFRLPHFAIWHACAVEGCGNPPRTKRSRHGLCNAHLIRLRRYGRIERKNGRRG